MRFLSILILLSTIITANASQHCNVYLSYLNNFDGFTAGVHKGKRLEFSNYTHLPTLAVVDRSFKSHQFTIATRFANLNNDENKNYRITDSLEKKSNVRNPIWGVAFNFESDSSYYAITLQGANVTPFDDISDERMLNCKLIRHINGLDSVLCETVVKNNINTFTGDNLLVIEHHNTTTSIKLGNETPEEIMVVKDLVYREEFKAGIICFSGSKVSMERFVVKSQSDPADFIKSSWTLESLNAHLSASTDPIEGYWQYLDRDIDENQLELGGHYKLALIKDGNGYDIIYIDGAKVNSSKWMVGMLKGKMTETIFKDEYNLVWYDSEMKAMDEELSAKVENGALLTLRFPIHNTMVRFSKMNLE